MAAMAGAACHRRRRVRHLVQIGRFRNGILFQVLGHGVHDPGDLFFRLGVVVKLKSRTAVWPKIVGIGSVAGVAVRAECASPSFHDVVNLVSGQVLGKHLEIFGGWEVARLACRSRRRTLRCLGDGGYREDCAGNDGDRDGGRGQGSDFQAFSSLLEVSCKRGCIQMDGILTNKDAPANR